MVSPGWARARAAASVGTGVPGRTTIWPTRLAPSSSEGSAAASISAGAELTLGGETEDLGPGEEDAPTLGGERAGAGTVGDRHDAGPHWRREPLAPHEHRGRGGDQRIGMGVVDHPDRAHLGGRRPAAHEVIGR